MVRKFFGALAGVSTRNMDTFRAFHNSTPFKGRSVPKIRHTVAVYQKVSVKRIEIKKFRVPKSWDRVDRYIALRIFELIKKNSLASRADVSTDIPAQLRIRAKKGKTNINPDLVTSGRVEKVFKKLVKLGNISYDAHHAKPIK